MINKSSEASKNLINSKINEIKNTIKSSLDEIHQYFNSTTVQEKKVKKDKKQNLKIENGNANQNNPANCSKGLSGKVLSDIISNVVAPENKTNANKKSNIRGDDVPRANVMIISSSQGTNIENKNEFNSGSHNNFLNAKTEDAALFLTPKF